MKNAELPVGSSAVFGPARRPDACRRFEGGEDPWLCGPGFSRVCLFRRFNVSATTAYDEVQGSSRGQNLALSTPTPAGVGSVPSPYENASSYAARGVYI